MAAHPKSLSASATPSKPSVAKTSQPAPRKVRGTAWRGHREPIAAAKAKTHFLRLLDDVQRDGKPITITKRGCVVAQLVPMISPKTSALEAMIGRTRGMMKITGDIVSPDHEFWGPDWR